MWAGISNKNKLKLLAAGGILLLIICYQFSVKRTIEEYKQYQQYVSNNQQQSATDQSFRQLEEKEKKIKGLFEQYALDTLDNTRNLLSIAGNFCQENDLTLKEYKPFPVSPADTIKILTRYVLVEGRYVDCLKLVHALETKYQAGKVNSVLFKSYTDMKTSKTYLQCGMYVQNLINNAYEKK